MLYHFLSAIKFAHSSSEMVSNNCKQSHLTLLNGGGGTCVPQSRKSKQLFHHHSAIESSFTWLRLHFGSLSPVSAHWGVSFQQSLHCLEGKDSVIHYKMKPNIDFPRLAGRVPLLVLLDQGHQTLWQAGLKEEEVV